MKAILLLFFISHLGLSLTQKQQISIGAIFFLDEPTEIEAAFDKAVYILNQRSSEVQLFPIKRYGKESKDKIDSIDLQTIACELIGNGVSAIFGPSSNAPSDIVALICNSTGIPNILFDWSPEESMTERMNHRMTVNVAPSTTILSKAYSDIVYNYAWKGYTVLYENHEALVRLQDLLQLKRIHEEEIKVRQFSRDEDFRTLWKNVRHQGERRVILDCSPELLADVVDSATFFNMTGQFNNLFLTNLDTHKSNLRLLNNANFRVNITAVRIELNSNEFIEDNSVMSTLVFDAVLLLHNAINNVIASQQYFAPRISCESTEKWEVGNLILEQMLQTSEENGTFITKNIQFNEWGERVNFNLEIYRPMSDRVIAVWNPDGQLMAKTESSSSVSKSDTGEIQDFSQGRRHYRVASRIGKPYLMLREPGEKEILSGNARFEGYSIDLIHKLSQIVGFDYTFDIVDDDSYGKYNPETKQWDGIVGYLIDHKADIGICDLTITQARRSAVDFTVPFMQLGISILYFKTPPEAKDLFAFLKPFDVEVWMYMLTSYLIISLVSIVMARVSRDEWENPHPCNPNPEELENKWDIANTSWLTMGSLMAQGCDILPKSGPMRLMSGMWWFFSLMMLNSYTANLAAFLTASKMESAINSINDLAEQNKIQFGTLSGGSTSNFFSESNDTVYRLAWSKMVSAQPTVFTKSNAEGVDRVRKNKNTYAFLIETTSMEYAIENDEKCELTQIGSQIGEKHYGIAVPLGADYRSNLSVAILKLSERGELFSLKKKWWANPNKTCSKADVVDGNELSIEELGGVFLVLGCGIFGAFVLGIIEFLWNVQQVAVEERLTPMEALKSEVMFALKFWIKKKPVKILGSSSGSGSGSESGSTSNRSRRSSVQSQQSTAKHSVKKVSIE
ncbi:glutamate receptor ionotropic, kainate 2-like [Eupeodes corollae]|uniref:glutamate receptor ionotropic, kainate 2-like n=1 Tax=Eupeodes corollae TaxID=290404 RepID=UPI00249089F1|nr:glutamate receptor ionotropic, kainate 2-like [Eupeodes corollae]